jgi:Protein of unknown function (DUF2442)
VIGDHELRLLFEDGAVGDIAFGDDERRGVFAPLRDPELFAQVCVDPQAGTIVWPGDLDMAPEALYLQARAPGCGAGNRLITAVDALTSGLLTAYTARLRLQTG